MKKFGVRPEDISMMFITHLHPDHRGGNDESSDHTFSLSRGPVKLKPFTVYAPDDRKDRGAGQDDLPRAHLRRDRRTAFPREWRPDLRRAYERQTQ